MGQKGWIDPATGLEASFEHWLEEAERTGEALGYPYEVLSGMARQLSGEHRPDGITVTQLLGCARAVHLEGESDFYAPAHSGYDAFRGTIGHAMLEDNPHPAAVVEERFWRTYKGETISGQLDKFMVLNAEGEPDREMAEQWVDYCRAAYFYESSEDLREQEFNLLTPFDPATATFLIEDWKTKDKVPFGIYVYDHHKSQGNLYRWLLRIPKDNVRVKFVYVSMTEVKGLYVYNGGKFANGRERPVQVWTDEEAEAFLDDRMRILSLQRNRGKPLPYAKVPVEDLWQCDWCPVKEICYMRAGDEALEAFQRGEGAGRVPPRDPESEKKVRLPRKKKEAA